MLPLQTAGLTVPKPLPATEIKPITANTIPTQALGTPPILVETVQPTPAPPKPPPGDPKKEQERREKAVRAAQLRAERAAQQQAEREARLKAEREAQLRAEKEAKARKAAEQQQAIQISRQASDARLQARHGLSLNPNKRSWLMKADGQLMTANEAYQRGEYAQATTYYRAAIETYQKAGQINVDDGIGIMKKIIRFR